MDIFSQLTDDQVALIGCGLAFAVCGGLLSLSYHLGQAKEKKDRPQETLAFPKVERASVSDRKKAA